MIGFVNVKPVVYQKVQMIKHHVLHAYGAQTNKATTS